MFNDLNTEPLFENWFRTSHVSLFRIVNSLNKNRVVWCLCESCVVCVICRVVRPVYLLLGLLLGLFVDRAGRADRPGRLGGGLAG